MSSNIAKPLVELQPTFRDCPLEKVRDLSLATVAGVPVKAELHSFQGAKNSFLHKDALTTVQVSFGKLSVQQFETLRSAFGNRSAVAFDGERSYSVIDFLPPVIQALVNKDIELPKSVTLKGSRCLHVLPFDEDKSVSLSMNCHATAWEAVRSYQGHQADVSIFMGEMITMDDLMTSDVFIHIDTLPADKVADLDKLDLRPGDVVQFHEKSDMVCMTSLLHSATYVGGGLYFEKPNTERDGEDSPFRLATQETMTMPVSDAVDGKFEVQVFRAQKDLKPAENAFQSSVASDVEKWVEKQGRSLGVYVVSELEQSMGGGIHGEYITGLVKIPLAIGDDGRAVLKGLNRLLSS